MSNLTKEIRKAMVDQGTDAKRLAKRMGLSETTLGRWIRTADTLPLDKLKLICCALNMNPETVFRAAGFKFKEVK